MTTPPKAATRVPPVTACAQKPYVRPSQQRRSYVCVPCAPFSRYAGLSLYCPPTSHPCTCHTTILTRPHHSSSHHCGPLAVLQRRACVKALLRSFADFQRARPGNHTHGLLAGVNGNGHTFFCVALPSRTGQDELWWPLPVYEGACMASCICIFVCCRRPLVVDFKRPSR
jgi:hypothetical protein